LRPRIKDEYKRKYRFTINFDESEWRLINDNADSSGVKLSIYLRRLCTKTYASRPKVSTIDAKLISQFHSAIGMLKHFYNESGGFMANDTATAILNIREIIKLIKDGAYHDRESYSEQS
jgi:hypothetical protein